MKFTRELIKAAHALAKQAKTEGFDYRASFGLVLRHLIKFGVNTMAAINNRLAAFVVDGWFDDLRIDAHATSDEQISQFLAEVLPKARAINLEELEGRRRRRMESVLTDIRRALAIPANVAEWAFGREYMHTVEMMYSIGQNNMGIVAGTAIPEIDF